MPCIYKSHNNLNSQIACSKNHQLLPFKIRKQQKRKALSQPIGTSNLSYKKSYLCHVQRHRQLTRSYPQWEEVTSMPLVWMITQCNTRWPLISILSSFTPLPARQSPLWKKTLNSKSCPWAIWRASISTCRFQEQGQIRLLLRSHKCKQWNKTSRGHKKHKIICSAFQEIVTSLSNLSTIKNTRL